MADRYRGDYGQTWAIPTTGMALGTATEVRIVVIKPSGQEVVWVPLSVVGETVNYTFAQGDLDEAGLYYGAVRATYPTERRYSSRAYLSVGDRAGT